MNSPYVILSLPGLVFAFIVLAIVTLWPLGSAHEGRYLPVVTDVQIDFVAAHPYEDEGGAVIPAIDVEVWFNKSRQCDFLGIRWFDGAGQRVFVNFLELNGRGPITRPVGDNQFAGRWRLVGLADLGELLRSAAFAEHRCHPLWNTFTPFYP